MVVRGTAAFLKRIPEFHGRNIRQDPPHSSYLCGQQLCVSRYDRGTLGEIDNISRNEHFLRVSNNSGKVLRTFEFIPSRREVEEEDRNLEEEDAFRREVPRARRQNRGGGIEKWRAKVKGGR